ncbi:MAG: RNA-directed DNA polymerase, partial [bacterium]
MVESKLTEEERDLLDRPLSIIELDESVRKLNLKSAPGIDGVSNKFISKFWPYFREPLHRYASDCVRKGSLTETFRTAIIRLIPKKGDTTQLKNWRPISLLSCYYKIISKALNERLGKVIGKVTSMAQKAYNPDRYLHEAIINTVETIKHCQKKNVEGLLISVDLHKAFDSVFHEFMREVYKFFGFGDYFIRLSETLGNGRCAKIILDSGKFSENIELLRCRPQGDSPSPRQFN